eukprot:TRINITY_DN93208_c0_g1_i1.p1 TRINITY_DN93208_c0_g1~~TRINITY_DN93208_c0_g1_i1.p1  ORF type:complete len:755 (+),score=177.55 TRINITY_DN93208_c0_g1_i1:116-2380(+)
MMARPVATDAASSAAGVGQDGLQFLCSKYSSLITKLREEVLSRQQAEAESRLLEKRLREESQVWEQEKSQMASEHRRLREEIVNLKSQLQSEKQQREQTWGVPSRRCNRCGAQFSREPSPSGTPRDSRRAHFEDDSAHQLHKLQSEYRELEAEHRHLQEELRTCKEHAVSWRRKATDCEAQANTAIRNCEESENRVRCAQEEMRQALRSASSARSRERVAERTAQMEEQQLRDREERLKALRHDSRLNARRASSAERRLAMARSCELECRELEREGEELRQRLRIAQEQGETLRVSHQRAEQAEARAAERAGEARGELRAAEALGQASAARIKDLEVQLTAARDALAGVEADHASKSTLAERLGGELANAQASEHEAWEVQAKQGHELHETRRRLERLIGGSSGGSVSGGKLAECKRRISELEQACGRKDSEVAEERRARERCHLEAVKASEKLRLARAQGAQLRERLRALEEAELRFPSRSRTAARLVQGAAKEQQVPQLGGGGRAGSLSRTSSAPAGKTRSRLGAYTDTREQGAEEPTALRDEWSFDDMPLLSSEPRPPPSATKTSPIADYLQPWPTSTPGGTSTTSNGLGAQDVRDFVAQEEERLSYLRGGDVQQGRSHSPATLHSPGHPAHGNAVSMPTTHLSWEEKPRSIAPAQASEPLAVVHKDDMSLSSLLAVQPRVLRTPGELPAAPSEPKAVDSLEAPTPRCTEPCRAQDTTCPSCGNVYMADANFCRHCGNKRDHAVPKGSETS